MNSFIETFAIR